VSADVTDVALQMLRKVDLVGSAGQHLAASARALALARAAGRSVLECLCRLHTSRMKVLLHLVAQGIIQAVARMLSAARPTDDFGHAEALMTVTNVSPDGSVLAGDARGHAAALAATAQHCFLPALAWSLHERGAWPCPEGVTPAHEFLTLPLTGAQRAALLLWDAVAALQWCEAQHSYAPASNALATFYDAAGLLSEARQRLEHILCLPDGGRFAPEHALARSGQASSSSAVPALPAVQAIEPAGPIQQWGLRPEQPLGACLCSEPSVPVQAARLRKYLVRYLGLCRRTGVLGGQVDMVEWGLGSRWGRKLPGGRQLGLCLDDIGQVALGCAAPDVLAAVRGLPAAASAFAAEHGMQSASGTALGIGQPSAQLLGQALLRAIRLLLTADPTSSRPLAGGSGGQDVAPARGAGQTPLGAAHAALKAAWRLWRLLECSAGKPLWPGVEPAVDQAADFVGRLWADGHQSVCGPMLPDEDEDDLSPAVFLESAKVRRSSHSNADDVCPACHRLVHAAGAQAARSPRVREVCL
jgi:hypothetical protein